MINALTLINRILAGYLGVMTKITLPSSRGKQHETTARKLFTMTAPRPERQLFKVVDWTALEPERALPTTRLATPARRSPRRRLVVGVAVAVTALAASLAAVAGLTGRALRQGGRGRRRAPHIPVEGQHPRARSPSLGGSGGATDHGWPACGECGCRHALGGYIDARSSGDVLVGHPSNVDGRIRQPGRRFPEPRSRPPQRTLGRHQRGRGCKPCDNSTTGVGGLGHRHPHQSPCSSCSCPCSRRYRAGACSCTRSRRNDPRAGPGTRHPATTRTSDHAHTSASAGSRTDTSPHSGTDTSTRPSANTNTRTSTSARSCTTSARSYASTSSSTSARSCASTCDLFRRRDRCEPQRRPDLDPEPLVVRAGDRVGRRRQGSRGDATARLHVPDGPSISTKFWSGVDLQTAQTNGWVRSASLNGFAAYAGAIGSSEYRPSLPGR